LYEVGVKIQESRLCEAFVSDPIIGMLADHVFYAFELLQLEWCIKTLSLQSLVNRGAQGAQVDQLAWNSFNSEGSKMPSLFVSQSLNIRFSALTQEGFNT
jgi:hypothetical protein